MSSFLFEKEIVDFAKKNKNRTKMCFIEPTLLYINISSVQGCICNATAQRRLEEVAFVFWYNQQRYKSDIYKSC